MSDINSGAGRVAREQRGGLFLIGLDRAGKRNAFDSHMILALSEALGEYERNPELRCAVLHAQGEHFTSGLDLMELAPKLASGGLSYPETGLDPWGVTGPRRSKPLVIAVEGLCLTAGIELVLNADIAVASSSAHFAQKEVLRGIPPSGGATVRFMQAAGWSDAMRYMLTGDDFDAATALRMRLLSEVVEPGQALAKAIEYAERIAKAAPLAIQATLKSAIEAREEGSAVALMRINSYLLELIGSEDVREGIMAMMQKRDPVFCGR